LARASDRNIRPWAAFLAGAAAMLALALVWAAWSAREPVGHAARLAAAVAGHAPRLPIPRLPDAPRLPAAPTPTPK